MLYVYFEEINKGILYLYCIAVCRCAVLHYNDDIVTL
jgi:hypothetical protein